MTRLARRPLFYSYTISETAREAGYKETHDLCERSNNRTNLNIDTLKGGVMAKTDSQQTTVHAKVKEGRFNIGPSEQETLGRR